MRRGGYILFETIVAMTLLSMAVLVVNQGMRQAVLARALAQDYTMARFLMEEILSGLEMQPEIQPGLGDKGQFSGVHSRFAYDWEVTLVEVPMREIPPDFAPEHRDSLRRMYRPYIAKFAVRISWTRAGLQHEVLGETLLPPERLWIPPEERVE